eukprot:TRINITY_DN4186_c0_g1_i1.p1 TRINITY_DN4186_c0_g1~~TRINITY_DN4186_c0_g1_i1.p1  ORF type:complete len:400 (+),score=79.67 TRINITY_DN4186_c0_g1_i1:65-1264(+)
MAAAVQYRQEMLEERDVTAEPLDGLMRADWLWNAGRSAEAVAALGVLEAAGNWNASSTDGLQARGLRALCGGDLAGALVAYSEASASDPSDIFLAQRACNVAFWLARPVEMLEVASKIDRSKPYAMGWYAFALHSNGRSAEAMEAATAGIAEGHDDPWALHAVAHALHSLGRPAEGVAWCDKHGTAYEGCSTFMMTHIWFHQALFFVDLGNAAGIDELCGGRLWGSLSTQQRRDYWAATGVIGVAWKSELYNITIGSPTTTAADEGAALAAEHAVNRSLVFSLCALRWRCRASATAAAALLGEMRAVARTDAETQVWVPTGEAIVAAYTEEDWEKAEAALPPMERLDELGGSEEQREVIHEFAALALRAAGKTEALLTWLAGHRRDNITWYETLLPNAS